MKQKINYRCSNCGYISIKWIGCCPACSEWNSFVEQLATKKNAGLGSGETTVTELMHLDEVSNQIERRMLSGIKEWDAVFGGGILPGSFLILTGDPGIGKSTLLLHVAHKIAAHYKVIYFSSEESLQQVKTRAYRLGLYDSPLLFSDQARLEGIIALGREHKPSLLILDSIQNCYLSMESTVIPGTIAQLREAGFHLMRLAKEHNIAVLMTGHVTKDGAMAGPKVLEHMVDAVFYLQAEDRWQTRILRSVKNRFGPINEVGFFQMQENGLQEISNINQQLLSEVSSLPGSVLVCSLEGSRPILLELQALVVPAKFGMAQRVVTGLDQKQVVLIAAILEKYLQIKLSLCDIFFKVSGGFRARESSSDLAIALALLSSYFQITLPKKSVAIAEIGLTGQIRPTNQIDVCIKEIEKFGLDHVFIAESQKVKSATRVTTFKNIYELLRLFPEQGQEKKESKNHLSNHDLDVKKVIHN